MRNPPAFQCYASDWLARESFRLATLQERGLLFTMLNQVWVSDSLPENPAELAKLLGLSLDVVNSALTDRVLTHFQANGDGRLTCPELAELKSKYLSHHAERSAAGKRGAEVRYRKRNEPYSLAIAEPSRVAIAAPEMNRVEQRRNESSRENSVVPLLPTNEEVAEYKKAFGEA